MPTAVTQVTLEPNPGSGVTVCWELDGGDAAVDVAIGRSPEAIDHVHAHTVAAGTHSLALAGLDRADRQFVSVGIHGQGAAVVAGLRRLPFSGADNFRDLGGYRSMAGGRLRWGRVFRADSLHALTDEDRAAFGRLGLRVVYDLRSEQERQLKPSALPSDADLDVVSMPLIGAGRGELSQLSVADGAEFLLAVYRGMITTSAPLFGRLLGGLAGPGGLPAVFHCAAGKDRTGVTAALLLTALGVSEADVLDDYELTARHRSEVRRTEILATLDALGVPPELAAGLLQTPRWVMQTLLEDIRRDHGGIDAYLTGPAGLSVGGLGRLRAELVA